MAGPDDPSARRVCGVEEGWILFSDIDLTWQDGTPVASSRRILRQEG